MQRERHKRYVENLMRIFQTARQTNIISRYYRNIQEGFYGQFLYIITPLLLYSVNLINLIGKGVLYRNGREFVYVNDIGNSLGLTVLFFLSYFLSGYFPKKFDEFMMHGTSQEVQNSFQEYKNPDHFSLFRWIYQMALFGIVFAVVILFYNVIKNNDAYWMKMLDKFGILYYCFLLGVTWYCSLTVLCMTVSAGMLIFCFLRDGQMVYREDDYNRNISVIKALDVLVCIISHGLVYISGSVIVVLNDRIAVAYGIHYLFYNDIYVAVFALFIVCLTVLECIPLKELLEFMRTKKDEMIVRLNRQIEAEGEEVIRKSLIEKRDGFIAEKLVMTTAGNKVMIILSVMIPLAGIVLQGMELYAAIK